MDLRERLQFCKKCERREFNRNVGIVCGLTKEKPNFMNACDSYIMDVKEAKKMYESEVKSDSSYASYEYSNTRNTYQESEEEQNPVLYGIGVIIAIIVAIIKIMALFR